MDMAVTVLPQPDSPTIPRVRPFLQLEGQAVDCLHQATLGVEARLKVLNLQQIAHRRSPFDSAVIRYLCLTACTSGNFWPDLLASSVSFLRSPSIQ